ncbi:MAG: hypothetical protein Q7T04_07125 [Dehalococcoidia bacterium]|nr:hypothetical protein [Dehalococcoidia bacterium]
MREEAWWFISAIAVEIIAIGAGLMISPAYGFITAIVGLMLLALAIWRIFKAKGHANKVVVELTSLIPQGEDIRKLCYDQKKSVPKQQANDWAEKVAIILDKLGSYYRPVFFNDDGLGTAKIPPMYSHEHQVIALFISYRLMRIEQFLGELRKKQ